MSEFRIDQIKSQDASRGPDVAGITTFTGTSGIVMPSGDTAYRGGRGRFVMVGGFTPAALNTMDYVTISSTGNAVDFGDASIILYMGAGTASSTRGLFHGFEGSPASRNNQIDYITIQSTGNSFDFGDLTKQSQGSSGASSDGIRAVFQLGWNSDGTASLADIDRVTIATLGNASYFGDLTVARNTGKGGFSSPTRGFFAGGQTPVVNTIDYVTIASTGDAVDFGDIAQGAYREGTGCSNSTRGLMASGSSGGDGDGQTISYITMSSSGNSITFGDLSADVELAAGGASATRGLFGGGTTPVKINTISYVTIATTGDSVDFGDRTINVYGAAGLTDAHGGLGD